MNTTDVVTFGEAMVRLAPPHFQRLEQARTLDIEIGGAELNTAAGLVQLGRTAEWVSLLPDQPLGRIVSNRAREAGVQTNHVQFTAEGRCGLYFLEFGAAPRSSSILYDRKNSSISLATPKSFDWVKILTGARWFHVTGITVALSQSTAETVHLALATARKLGIPTSIDLNYRSKLWTTEQAGKVMRTMMPMCDLLFASEGDALQLFGIQGSTFADIARQFNEHFGIKYIAGVKRETPLVWRNKFGAVGYSNGQFHETPWYEVEIVDRLGAGDALASGVIHGLLDGDFNKGLEYGAAMGAIKHTIPGDLPWIPREEVEAVLAGTGLRIRR